MNEYMVLGELYDCLNSDMDYPKLCQYIIQIFEKYGNHVELVLDLGCGTGELVLELLKHGYDLIGLDNSPIMLQKAVEKTEAYRDRALFINQDMLDFELYGTVDAIVSTMDVVNHVLNKRDLKKIFQNVYHYLNYDGLFIFDINTEYKLKKIIGNNIFTGETNEINYIWENNIGQSLDTIDFNFTFFVSEGDLYRKYQESYTERAYRVADLEKMLIDCGFELLGIFDERTFQSPDSKAKRVFFVAKKIDNSSSI